MRRTLEAGLRIVLLLPLLTSGCGDKPTEAAPHLSAHPTPLGACVVTGGSLTFDVVLDSRGTPPYTYAWTFSDPAIPSTTGQNPSVTFPNHGTVDVQMTVTDSRGETSTSGTSVHVKNDCSPVVATITQPATDVTVPQGDTVDFAARERAAILRTPTSGPSAPRGAPSRDRARPRTRASSSTSSEPGTSGSA